MLPVRVLIADDHELVRRGLSSLLSSRPGWEIVGEARDGVEAVELAKELHPDLILLDVTMPRLNGLDAARAIRQDTPDIFILILSQHAPREMSAKAYEAGAHGFVSKSEVAAELFAAMEAIIDTKQH